MRHAVFFAALFAGAAAAAAAQEAAPEKPQGGDRLARIAVIDMGRISTDSLMGKGYAAQLEALKNEIDSEGTKKQNELQKLDQQIKALQEELEKQASVLSPEAVEKKSQEIKKKQRDRQAFVEDGQAELERMRERARQQAQVFNNEFQQKIRPHIEAVAKDKGIDILLDSQVALTVSRAFDVTQDVIVKADDAERSGKAAVGAAKPPAEKPAAAAKPSPAPSPQP
ncbi:MAG: OmpH family outer membrane protein [Acidobacteria bacterium]|nr:OmpH family outer membrane protein [Acidobacteriota bacterium]